MTCAVGNNPCVMLCTQGLHMCVVTTTRRSDLHGITNGRSFNLKIDSFPGYGGKDADGEGYSVFNGDTKTKTE